MITVTIFRRTKWLYVQSDGDLWPKWSSLDTNSEIGQSDRFFLLEAIIGGHGMIFDQSDGNLWPKWSPCLSDTLYISITSVDKCQSFLRLIWILSADCNAGRSCRLGRSHLWRRLPRCCRRAQARTRILMQWHVFEMWWFSNNLSWNEKRQSWDTCTCQTSFWMHWELRNCLHWQISKPTACASRAFCVLQRIRKVCATYLCLSRSICCGEDPKQNSILWLLHLAPESACA